MEKSEFRVLIKHYFLRNKTIKQTEDKLQKYYGESAPSHFTVHKWFTEFRCGRTSTKTIPSPGRPKEVTSKEIVNKIHDIVLEDCRVTITEIADIVKISTERIHNILHEHLGMRKLSARWVPRVLTAENKRNRVTASMNSLEMFHRDPDEFLQRFVTVDEIWIHHNAAEATKDESAAAGCVSAAKKAKTVPSAAGKVMATVFWDSHGIIYIEYLNKEQTMTAANYSDLLDRFNVAFTKKRPDLCNEKIIFHHDNTSAHASSIVAAKLHDLGYELLPHPPYSPDLAPCDFFLFPNMKKKLAGIKLKTNDEVIAETEAYFAELPKTYFLDGLKKMEYRWTKCIDLQGDYIEK